MNWYKKSEKYHKGIPKSCQAGDCYCAAGHYLMEHGMSKPNLVLVHGEVTGQGKIKNIKYGHAWIEDGDMVIDNSQGRHIELPKMVYYALGNIEPEKTFRYTLEQMRKKILDTEHWGPWELVTKY
jgi:hypothetical protein